MQAVVFEIQNRDGLTYVARLNAVTLVEKRRIATVGTDSDGHRKAVRIGGESWNRNAQGLARRQLNFAGALDLSTQLAQSTQEGCEREH